jgi:hypothetical protein
MRLREVAAFERGTPDLLPVCPHCHTLNGPQAYLCSQCNTRLLLTPRIRGAV